MAQGDVPAAGVGGLAASRRVPQPPMAEGRGPSWRVARGHDNADVHREGLARGTVSLMADTESWADTPTARWWHALDDGRLECDLCPRRCRLHAGQRGFCFVRARDGDRMVLTTYGRSSGFAIDPIEKKPLAHFHPGTSVLSFGTAGCNLNCRFCQNWDISKSREWDRLAAPATPDAIAQAAASRRLRLRGVHLQRPRDLRGIRDRHRGRLPRAGPQRRRRHGGLHHARGPSRLLRPHGRARTSTSRASPRTSTGRSPARTSRTCSTPSRGCTRTRTHGSS